MESNVVLVNFLGGKKKFDNVRLFTINIVIYSINEFFGINSLTAGLTILI